MERGPKELGFIYLRMRCKGLEAAGTCTWRHGVCKQGSPYMAALLHHSRGKEEGLRDSWHWLGIFYSSRHNKVNKMTRKERKMKWAKLQLILKRGRLL